MSDTLTSDGDLHARAHPAGTGDFLFYVLAANRASGDSTRHSLADIDEVLIGRDDRPGCRRKDRRLSLTFDDRWMSVDHARMYRRDQGWRLDCGQAKNGGYRNGQRITGAGLRDGDVMELGHSFFVFRAAQPFPRGAPLDVSATGLPAAVAGLRSLSPQLNLLFAAVAAVAPSRLPFVITGDTGTGKELLARAIHELGGRGGPFIAVNCGALPLTLAESELFGFRKGTFSGATEDRPGLVRAAHGGTLFLDEVVELAPSIQTALLRVLQEREVLALGATQPVPVDFRLIVASHGDLDEAVASGRFREDLRARLHGFTARLPPLRERREDMGLLLDATAAAYMSEPLLLGHSAARDLLARPWSSNVRELASCLSMAVTLARDGIIESHHLRGELSPAPAGPSTRAPAKPRPSARNAAHHDRLAVLVEEHHGNVTHVARALGKPRVQVYRWIKRYGIDLTKYR